MEHTDKQNLERLVGAKNQQSLKFNFVPLNTKYSLPRN